MSDTERIHKVVEGLIDWFDEAGIKALTGDIYIEETPDEQHIILGIGLYSDEPNLHYVLETHVSHPSSGKVVKRRVAWHTYDREIGRWLVEFYRSEKEIET